MLIDDTREDLEAFGTRRLKKTLQKCKIGQDVNKRSMENA